MTERLGAPGSRAAHIVFLGAFFLAGISGISLVEIGAIGALLLYGFARGRLAGMHRVLLVGWGSTLTVLLYFWVRQLSPSWGQTSDYLRSGLSVTAVLVVCAAMAWVLYEEHLLVDLFWRFGRVALLVALAGFALTRLGMPVLSHTGYGAARLQGTLTEPSAWAPVVPAMILLSVQRRAYGTLLAVAVAGFLTRSPVVYIATLVSVGVYYLVRRQSRRTGRKIFIVVALTLVTFRVYGWTQHVDYQAMLNSESSTQVALGRLVSGVRNAQSHGDTGTNTRFAGAQDTVKELHAEDWYVTGMGPGASDVYFPAKSGDVRSYSLVLSTLFDLGIVGCVLLVALMMRAVWRMRRSELAALLIPFLVASSVNSAQGWETYKFAVLAVMLFAFGCATGGRRAASRSCRSSGPQAAMPAVARRRSGPGSVALS